jgi:hypothetical protein
MSAAANGSNNDARLPYILKKSTFKRDFDTAKDQMKSLLKNNSKQLKTKACYKNWLFRRLPIIEWLFVDYKIRDYLQKDLFAGFTVGIMSLPQSMA